MESISTLPVELHYGTLRNLPYPDMLVYCQSHTVARDICEDNLFWKDKYEHDYRTLPLGPIYGWRQAYEERHHGVWMVTSVWPVGRATVGLYHHRQDAISGTISYVLKLLYDKMIYLLPDSSSVQYSKQFEESPENVFYDIAERMPLSSELQRDAVIFVSELKRHITDTLTNGTILPAQDDGTYIHIEQVPVQ